MAAGAAASGSHGHLHLPGSCMRRACRQQALCQRTQQQARQLFIVAHGRLAHAHKHVAVNEVEQDEVGNSDEVEQRHARPKEQGQRHVEHGVRHPAGAGAGAGGRARGVWRAVGHAMQGERPAAGGGGVAMIARPCRMAAQPQAGTRVHAWHFGNKPHLVSSANSQPAQAAL